eukprot:SAG31_NODE_6831_length_1875_cov_1.809685_2_plen_42_part_00
MYIGDRVPRCNTELMDRKHNPVDDILILMHILIFIGQAINL